MSLLLQESALSEALARLAGDIDQKLDRLELDPLKDHFGECWRYFPKYILSGKLDYLQPLFRKRVRDGSPENRTRESAWNPASLARELFWEISLSLSLDIVSQPGADILPVKFRAILVNKSF